MYLRPWTEMKVDGFWSKSIQWNNLKSIYLFILAIESQKSWLFLSNDRIWTRFRVEANSSILKLVRLRNEEWWKCPKLRFRNHSADNSSLMSDELSSTLLCPIPFAKRDTVREGVSHFLQCYQIVYGILPKFRDYGPKYCHQMVAITKFLPKNFFDTISRFKTH